MPTDLISCLAAVCSHLLFLAHWALPSLNNSSLQRQVVDIGQPFASQSAIPPCEQYAGEPAVGTSKTIGAEVLACMLNHLGYAIVTTSNPGLMSCSRGCLLASTISLQSCFVSRSVYEGGRSRNTQKKYTVYTAQTKPREAGHHLKACFLTGSRVFALFLENRAKL